MAALDVEDTKFLEFQFNRMGKICDSINVKNKSHFIQADSIIKQIAKETLILADSIKLKVDMKKLIRYKLFKENKELEKMDKKQGWKALLKRSYGLMLMAKYLNDRPMFRKFEKEWYKYRAMLKEYGAYI